MVQVATNFIAAGGNRQPNAADWDQHGSRLLAYGAGNNIALWDPLVSFIFFGFSHISLRLRISSMAVPYRFFKWWPNCSQK